MKKIMILGILIAFLITGCYAVDPIVDDMFGWIPGYQPRSTQTSTQTATQQTSTSQSPYCEPHGRFDGVKCICDAGYVARGMDCVAGNRECVYDKDCGTNTCQGDYKLVYRCDLRTYKCTPSKGVPAEKVNCKTDYGANYICLGGECIFNPSPGIPK